MSGGFPTLRPVVIRVGSWIRWATRMRSILRVASVVLAFSWAMPAARAEALPPQPGTRVRLTLSCEGRGQPADMGAADACRLVGRLVRLRADTLTLESTEKTNSWGLGTLRRLEVSQGRRGHWLVGAGAGAVLGGVAFVLLTGSGSTAICDRDANQDALSPGECAGLSAAAVLVMGGVGAIVGGLIRSESWRELSVEDLRVSLAPRPPGKLGIAVRLGF
jgi:hypothetical protein